MEQEALFTEKFHHDAFSYPDEIIGRESQAKELVRYLFEYKSGHAVPLVSVYGMPGSGKSTIVRYVCENLEGALSRIVNLRTVNTSFGCANLILGSLDEPSLKSANGINVAISMIEETIFSKLKKEQKNFFVLVLDEFDGLVSNKKERLSDFVYKLLVIEENLKKRGLLMSIVCIANDALVQHSFDARVKSRIGSSDVFFEPYSKEYVAEILSNRAKKTLAYKVDKSVIEYCAELVSEEHGDARRAVDLFRTAVKIASKNKEEVTKFHVDKALRSISSNKTMSMVATASEGFRIACFCLARLSYLTSQSWHSTSAIHKQYETIMKKGQKRLGYRRFSEYLTEIANSGIAISRIESKGRGGYGASYKLTMPPHILGRMIKKEVWENIEEVKAKHDAFVKNEREKSPTNQYHVLAGDKVLEWSEYVGI